MKRKLKKELQNIAKDEMDAAKDHVVSPHSCPVHVHDRADCGRCMSMYMDGWSDVIKTKPITKKEIIHRPYWYKVIIGLFIGLGIGYGVGWSYPDWKPPVHDGGYPVYITKYIHSDADVKALENLAECQSDWKADQVEKKVLRAKISSFQEYLLRSDQ